MLVVSGEVGTRATSQLEGQVRRVVAVVSAGSRDLTTDEAAEVLDAVGGVSIAMQGLLARMADLAARDVGRQALVVDDLRRAAAAASTLTDLVAVATGGLLDR